MAVKKAWTKTKTTKNSVTYSFVAQNDHGWVKAETKTKTNTKTTTNEKAKN